MNPFEMPSIEGKPPDPLRAGMKLFGDRYELVRPLGAGGMGVVWLAKNLVENSQCALKFLLQVFVQDAREMEKLREQVKKGKELHHARLVATYGLEADGPYAAIAMEYVEGVTLAQKQETSKKGFFEPDEISAWVHDLCEGLDYIHKEAGWAHRDIKPANIMLDTEGRVRLMDFGISQRIAQTITRLSRVEEKPGTGSSGSTLPYASPQQVASKPARPADDIYSVGALLYELLSGRPPFLGSDVGLLTAQILNTMPPAIKERRVELAEDNVIADSGGEIPPIWEAAVAKCLSKDPAERPETASLLWDWLQHGEVEIEIEEIHPEPPPVAAAARLPEPARAPLPTPQKKDEPVRANLTPVWLLLAVVLLVAGWWFGYELPNRNRAAAELQTRDAEIRQKLTALDQKQADELVSQKAAAQTAQDAAAKAKADLEKQKLETERLMAEKAASDAKAEAAKEQAKLDALKTEAEKKQRDAAMADLAESNRRAQEASAAAETARRAQDQLRIQQQTMDNRKASLSAFMQSHIDSYQSNNPDVYAGMFAPYSKYKYWESSGLAPRSFISKDRASYLKDYPVRSIQLMNDGKYSYQMRGDSKAEVSYSYSYRVSGKKSRTGQSHVEITVEYNGSEWQITKFDENVIRN